MNFAGTHKVNMEVRGVGQVISGLKIFFGSREREARQDVSVRVRVLRSVLQRESVRVQEVKPPLYAISLVRQTCEILKRLVICLDFKGDTVEHLSVKLDSPHDRGAFHLGNVPLALIIEGDSAEEA